MKCGDEVARSQKNKPSPEMTKLKEHHQTSFLLPEFSLLPQAIGSSSTGTGLDTNSIEQSKQIHQRLLSRKDTSVVK